MWKSLVLAAASWSGAAGAVLTPDLGFGVGGAAELALDGQYHQAAPRVAVLADRRIALAAFAYSAPPAPPTLLVARLLPDGRPDPSYGTDGRALLPLAPQPVDRAFVRAAQFRADGSLVLLASTQTVPSEDPNQLRTATWLLRVATDGRIDAGFNGGQAREVTDLRYSRTRLLLQGDAVLVVEMQPYDCCDGLGTRIRAMRYRADGSTDLAFGKAGILVSERDGSESRDAMAVPGGGFQILHRVPPRNDLDERIFWRRYRADGSLDTAFGSGGEAALPLIDGAGFHSLLAVGDGTWLAMRDESCARRLLDSQGALLRAFAGPCIGYVNAAAQRYGERILLSGEQRFGGLPPPSDGTYLHLMDRYGNLDYAFTGTADGRWRPLEAPSASYAVAADGAHGVVVARRDDGLLRVLRYADLRGGDGAVQPVPVLGPFALAALALCLAGLAVCRRGLGRV